MNRDVAQGLRDSVAAAMKDGQVASLFNSLSAVASHQFLMAPYYFALVPPGNQERHLIGRVTGHVRPPTQPLRVGVFTDCFDHASGTSRFARAMLSEATHTDESTIIHACTLSPRDAGSARKNFTPLISLPMPFYSQATFHMPPALEVLEWADRQQFDAIHVHTPGPMGLCGWLVAKMLRVPLIATFNTDFPAIHLRPHQRLPPHRRFVAGYTKWFCNQATTVLCRSRSSVKGSSSNSASTAANCIAAPLG